MAKQKKKTEKKMEGWPTGLVQPGYWQTAETGDGRDEMETFPEICHWHQRHWAHGARKRKNEKSEKCRVLNLWLWQRCIDICAPTKIAPTQPTAVAWNISAAHTGNSRKYQTVTTYVRNCATIQNVAHKHDQINRCTDSVQPYLQ